MQENNSPKAQATVKKNEIYVSVKRKKSTIEAWKRFKEFANWAFEISKSC